MPARWTGGNDHRRQSDWRKVSAVALAVLAGRDPGPLLERAVKGARLGEAELVGDVEQRHVGASEVLDRRIAPQVVFQRLEALTFFAQAAAQRLRRHAEHAADLLQRRHLAAQM